MQKFWDMQIIQHSQLKKQKSQQIENHNKHIGNPYRSKVSEIHAKVLDIYTNILRLMEIQTKCQLIRNATAPISPSLIPQEIEIPRP